MPSAEMPSPDVPAAGAGGGREPVPVDSPNPREGTLAPDSALGLRIAGACVAGAGASVAIAGAIAVARDDGRSVDALLPGPLWALPAIVTGVLAAALGGLLLLRGLRRRCGQTRFRHAAPGILAGLDPGPYLPGPRPSPGPAVESGVRPSLLRPIDPGQESAPVSVLFAVVGVSGALACWWMRPFAGFAGPTGDVGLHAAITVGWLVATLAGWTWWRWKHMHRHATGTSIIEAGDAIEVRIDGRVRPIARCALAAVQLAHAPAPTGLAGLMASGTLQLILVVRLNDGLLERIPLAAQCGHRDALALAAAALARELGVPLVVPPASRQT